MSISPLLLFDLLGCLMKKLTGVFFPPLSTSFCFSGLYLRKAELHEKDKGNEEVIAFPCK